MIAIIIAAAQNPAMYGLDEHTPLPLVPLGDRPILHHIIDYLASQGIRRFEFVLGHLPEKIEAYLGDGARWGCSFGFHLLPSGIPPFQMVGTIAGGLHDEIILGRGDRLPEFQSLSTEGPTLFLNDSAAWTGWAVLPCASRLFAGLDAYATGASPVHDAAFREVVTRQGVSFENPLRLLESQHDLLTGAFTGSLLGGRQTAPGIWISRNVSLHPTVQLRAPLYIGPNCKIEEGTRIGPFAVLGEGCIVDGQSSVVNTLVAPGTYVGQGLELENVIVDRNRLINAKIGTAFLVSDSFLLSSLARQKKPGPLHRLVSSIGAATLLLLLFPLAALTLLLLVLSGKAKFAPAQAVCIPAADDPRMWREYRRSRFQLLARTKTGWWVDFVAEVWPGLISVVKGKMFLVGVKPRSRHEVESLSSDWRSIYLNSKAGLITEASVMFGRAPSQDELYTAEAYYSATEGIRHDLNLLRLYLYRMISSNHRSQEDFDDSSLIPSLENLPERQ